MRTCIRIGRALFRTGVVVAAPLAAACNDDPKSGAGVNDVKAACELRVGWDRTREPCSLCESAVVSPRCECESLKAFSGACLEQAEERRAACADSVDYCVHGCQKTDCPCIEACYVAGDACKRASDARDGCIAEACAPHCQ